MRYSLCKALVIETTDIWYTRTHTHTHRPKPVCEHEGVTDLWNQGVHTERKVTANRPDIIIKNKNEKKHAYVRCGKTLGQKCRAKGNIK